MTLIEALIGVIALETSYLTYRNLSGAGTLAKLNGRGRIICDTSALIDGRIVALSRSGVIDAELMIPRSVIRELQFMADRADHDKRERARYGLDVVKELQDIELVTVTVYDDGKHPSEGVDERLLQLAKKLSARLCTTDYNLNKVARTEQVDVINLNEIAHALRPMHLPGETIQITIVSSGQNRDQGVGYLDDGTMVVVDGAKRDIGTTIAVETERMLQTEAGRMVFAHKASKGPSVNPSLSAKEFHQNNRSNGGNGRRHTKPSATKSGSDVSRRRRPVPTATTTDTA